MDEFLYVRAALLSLALVAAMLARARFSRPWPKEEGSRTPIMDNAEELYHSEDMTPDTSQPAHRV